ncbi:MAG: glycosyltransferase [Bacteroidales bacterium]|nr:glycosyltransferase [Bacteroidales bacterium]
MKKVLVITYYWPPSGGSGVQRWVKFTKYLPLYGWQSVIYTPENPEMPGTDHSLEADIPEGTTVVKTHISEIYGVYNKLSRGTSAAEVNPINSQKKSWKKKLAMWVRGNFFIPDPRISWVGPSVRFLKDYLKDNPVDAIVSTGPPHSMHLIGRKLSLATGIPWIADFRDPWTKLFYFKHLQLGPLALRKHQSLERKVLDDATSVVAVSPLVQEEFRSMTDTPVDLVTNGFDEDDFAADVAPAGGFTLVHTGLFAADGNPLSLWKALADKCLEDKDFERDLHIVLAGKTDREIISAIEAAGLGGKLRDKGYLSHSETVKLQKSATALMLPLRREPEYRATLPGKLFEYLGSRRPVIGIGQSDGAMAKVLSDTGAGQTFEWDDVEGIRLWLDRCYKDPLSTTGDISAYTRRGTAARMASILDEVASKRD